ncbi:STAS domain-containing protein [Nonomuraea angiospora]|uniref:Anti-sigma factor antagonist n=1 Tax=Nonomuraea angiospora TaxID=46172 RepID=A0ABR9LTU0_9ACTN|nr:STAS domain-containing protein [Nonomuraea angiospora]MBE1584057.1 anti-anti-sigma factor [Nonomuraea angiospora]
MGGLAFRRQHLPGVTVISVGGELDMTTAGEVEEVIRRAHRAGDDVVIDLAGTPFMDCAGLNALLRLRQEVGHDGGTVRLVALRREPARVLRLTGTERYLRVHRTLAEALAAATAARRPASCRFQWAHGADRPPPPDAS